MLFQSRYVGPPEFERLSGWAVRPEGLCRDDACVPLPPAAVDGDGRLDVLAVANRLRRPVVTDTARDLVCIGPVVEEPVLASAAAPDLVLPDVDGRQFALRSLRSQKVLLLAWASW